MHSGMSVMVITNHFLIYLMPIPPEETQVGKSGQEPMVEKFIHPKFIYMGEKYYYYFANLAEYQTDICICISVSMDKCSSLILREVSLCSGCQLTQKLTTAPSDCGVLSYSVTSITPWF